MEFENLFQNKKPLIGMIHTNRSDEYTVLELAQKEIEIYLKYDIYPLIENYFGSTKDCESILAWMQKEHPDALYGVNILGDYSQAFRLAKEYGASFIQIDSICGHLKPKADEEYAEQLLRLRKDSDVVLLGGVRFKYQPVLSGRSLEEDLNLGAERCDAIVCTGGGTGQPTPFDKVREFKTVLNNFPVIVGAGVTIDTICETFRVADGAIVGSWFKEMHRDCFNVNEEYVKQMKEIQMWHEALCENNLCGYQRYLCEFPEGIYAQAVKSIIEKMINSSVVYGPPIVEDESTEDPLWNLCKSRNDYQCYMDIYPFGKHRVEAEKRLRETVV